MVRMVTETAARGARDPRAAVGLRDALSAAGGERRVAASAPARADRFTAGRSAHAAGAARASRGGARRTRVRLARASPAGQRELPQLRRHRASLRGVERGRGARVLGGAEALVLPRS